MRWFNNLKIRIKFMLSFGVLTVLVALMGITGVLSSRNLEQQEITMHNSMTVPLKQLAELINHFQRMKVQSRDILMAESAEDISASVKKINSYIDGTRAILPDLKNRVQGTPLEAKFLSYGEKFSIYESRMKELINLVRGGQRDAANSLLRGEIYSSAREAQVSLEGLLKDMSEYMDTTYANTIENTADSQRTFLYFVICGVLIAVFLSIYASRSFTIRIVNITEAVNMLKSSIIVNLHAGAERLAKADLDLKIPRNVELLQNDSTDEIGDLANTVNEIITYLLSTVESIEKSVFNIREMVEETNRFAESASSGKLGYRCNIENFTGGFQRVVVGLNNSVDAFSAPMNEARTVLEQVSSGNLTVAMQGEYQGDYHLLVKSINELIRSLRTAIEEVELAVVHTAEAAANIAENADRMASGTAEQDRQTAEVASSVGIMEDVVTDSTRNAAIAADASKTAHQVAQSGGESLLKTVDGMNNLAKVVTDAAEQVKSLSHSNEQIGEIVLVIDDIANQTNLLALNAAIEAARAGEQGRGFAIVADEVRKLAERTSKATQEIDHMIRKVQTETNKAIESIMLGADEAIKGKTQANTTGKAMADIVGSAVKVSSVIDQVAAASEEQLSSLHEMRRNIEVISEVTHSSNLGIQHIKESSEQLNKLTGNLQALVNRFALGNERASQGRSRYLLR